MNNYHNPEVEVFVGQVANLSYVCGENVFIYHLFISLERHL